MVMVKRRYLILSYLLICLLLTSCKTSQDVFSKNKIEVQGLTLKYVLIGTSYDMFLANVEKPDYFGTETFKKLGKETSDYYDWLCKTYDALPSSKKQELKQIFSNTDGYHYMNITTQLKDDASIEDIVGMLTSNSDLNLDEKTKTAIENFLPYIYINYLNGYLKNIDKVLSERAERMQEQIDSINPDLLGFMEKNSGIAFPQKFKPIFYYYLSPITAYGFFYKDKGICTVPSRVNDIKDLLRVPFHEYSHLLFRTFTRDSMEFHRIASALKNDKDFEKMWSSAFNKIYDWDGWCEENLVHGFSAFLEYKYFGTINSWHGNYYYDYKFYNYLVNTQFSPDKVSLEWASLNFFKQQIRDK
jgi:hypothetical protein